MIHRQFCAFRRIAAVLAAALVALVAVATRGDLGARLRDAGLAVAERPRAQDAPDEAMRWVMLFQRDERGEIAPDGLMRARAQVDQLRAAQAARDPMAGATSVDATLAASGITPSAWTWIGPGNIGGRTRAIAVHPVSTSTIFAGSVGGGIWRTTNGGTSWAPVNDFMANLAVTSIVFQPGNPSVMFAGTGEGFFNVDAIRGAGIFISTDTGTTWTQVASTAPTPSNQNFIYVNRLAFSADGSTLLAATNTGLYRSIDLGASWTKTLAVNNMGDAKFLSGSSTGAVASSRARAAYYSTNGGLTWQIASGLNGSCPTGGSTGCRVELGVATSNPSIVYASLEVNGGNSQVWRSLDGGVTYTQTDVGATTSKLGAQGWYDNVVWVDPTNANHVIVGGVPLSRSTDGGVTFATIGGIHADHHAIVSDPGFNGITNRRVYFGNDGGLYKSETVSPGSAITFTNLNKNYGVTQFYGGSSVSTGRIFGGTQDNGSLLYTPANGPQAWTSMIGGDGGFMSGDPTNANYIYGELQWMQVHRSTNGTTSSSIAGCSKSAPYKLVDGCASSSSSANFIAPILLDPNDPNRLLAGGANLWRTSDARTPNTAATGPSWAIIKPSIGSNVSAIAIARGDADRIWIGHNNGHVYVTQNGTSASPTWTQRDAGGTPLPNRAVASIAVDPVDLNTAYVSFGGFNSQNLWVTHDLGATWTAATGGAGARLPDAPIRSVVVHPTRPGWVYAGTDVGVFASEDGGATWSLPHDGPANVAVFQLFFAGTSLVAVTHGRGMFVTATVPTNPPAGQNLTTNGDFSAGTGGWQFFEVPDIVHNGGAGGVLRFHRASPATTASMQAVAFQQMGQPVAAGGGLGAQFDLGNADVVSKRVSVVMHDADFSDLSVCTFWLPAAAPLRTYAMRTHATRNWANASISFYAASAGTGDYLLDNVSAVFDPGLSPDRTDCVDPLAPGPTGGAAGANLLVNGAFNSGTLSPWTTFGAILTQVVANVLEFARPVSPGTPAGVVLQPTGHAAGAGEIFTATFDLGNSSPTRKRVTVLIHDLDFTDLGACAFWLEPGRPLAPFAMRAYSTKPWSNVTLSVYPATEGADVWLRLDNVTLTRTPALAIQGIECVEPLAGSEAAPEEVSEAPRPTAARRSLTPAEGWTAWILQRVLAVVGR